MRRHVGQTAEPASVASRSTRETDALLQVGSGRVVRFEQRGAQRELVHLLPLAAARAPLRVAGAP
jgi:hypothetical protein